MENASKALIIAGAILLSILIIALGIYVFNMAKSASSTSSLDELEVSQFNQVFTNYRGKQLGSSVVDLLDKVVSNASANKESDERLPDVVYVETRTSGGVTNVANSSTGNSTVVNKAQQAGIDKASGDKTFLITSDSSEPHLSAIGSLRSKMAEKHYYNVQFVNNDETGLIQYVIIAY